MVKRRFDAIKILIAIIKFLIPTTVIFLKFTCPEVKFGWLFVGYAFFLTIERSLETFYSGKFNKSIHASEKDWTFKAVTLTYVIMAFMMILEFFLLDKDPIREISLLAIIVFFAAFILRLWSMKTLGGLWQTANKKRQLINDKGPYSFMRHPIYLGFMLEVLAVPLIPGTYYTFLFACFIFIPLILVKTYVEERYLLSMYTQGYIAYKEERWAFWPFRKGVK